MSIKWYTVDDIAAGYDLKPHRIKRWIRSGKILAMPARCHRMSNWSMYLIPECELHKLEHFKVSGPRFSEYCQPCDYLVLKRHQDEEEAIAALLNLNEEPKSDRLYSYRDYMNSEHWQQVRQIVFERDNWQCRRCGTAKDLRVHHISYAHLGRPEELDDVITLCDNCHYQVHSNDIMRKQHESTTS